MNSRTWLVELEGSTYVAKAVSPAAAADLVAGGEVATTLRSVRISSRASAVKYLGGTEHAAAFLSSTCEMGRSLPRNCGTSMRSGAFEKQSKVYFAGRLASNDLTGGIDHAENEKGLDDARQHLGSLGLRT